MSNIVGVNGAPIQSRPSEGMGNVTSTIKSLPVIYPAKMTPTKSNILLRVFEEAEISDGGIIKSESMVNKALMDKTTCVLVAAGELAFTLPNGDYWAEKPEVGDTVLTSKYAGNMYRDEKFNLYRHAHDVDVCFIVGDAK